MTGETLTCPGCGRRYPNLSAVIVAGGKVGQVGLKLAAECGECATTWAVNRAWKARERQQATTKERQT